MDRSRGAGVLIGFLPAAEMRTLFAAKLQFRTSNQDW